MKNWTNLSRKYVLNDTFVILDTCWQGNLQKTISICQVCLHLGLLVNISSTSSSNWSMNKVKGCFRQAVKRAVLSESMMKTNWAEDTTLALMPYFHIPRFHSAAWCLCEYWCKYSFNSFVVLQNTSSIWDCCLLYSKPRGMGLHTTLFNKLNWSSLLTYLFTTAMLL